MNPHLQRARILLSQGRHAAAEGELRTALAQDPHDGEALALLALALLGQDKLDEAERAAGDAIGQAPDLPFPHHVRGRVLIARRREEEAAAAAAEAIRLDPEDPNHRALLGQARFAQRRWPEALTAVEDGLRLDPEHGDCARLRALALVQSGRREEAAQQLGQALARDPDDAGTHVAMGWTRLEAGDAQAALTHFQEALRLDPTQEAARAGIVEALQAKHRLYALLLRYLMFMSKLGSGQQWLIIIGGWLGYRWLLSHASEHPERAPYLYPLIGLYLAFALLSWLGRPLFNLALRLDRFGRHALTQDQVRGANLVGALLLGALLLCAAWAATGSSLLSLAAIGAVLLLLPASAIHACEPGWPRRAMALYTLGLFLCGLAVPGVAILAVVVAPDRAEGLALGAAQLFLLGCLLSGFVANGLISARPSR